jgi:Acyltransferase C-terminus
LDIFKGNAHHGDMYIKRIPISQVPTEDDDQLAEFLYDMYQEKVNANSHSHALFHQ